MADLIDAVYASFIGGDLEAIESLLEPDVEFVNPPEAIEGGVRTGPDSFMTALRSLHSAFEYEDVRIVEREQRGDLVLTLVEFKASGKDSGAPFTGTFSHLFRFRGKRLAGFHWFPDEEAGRKALAELSSA